MELVCSPFYASAAILNVRNSGLVRLLTCHAVVVMFKLPEIYAYIILLNH